MIGSDQFKKQFILFYEFFDNKIEFPLLLRYSIHLSLTQLMNPWPRVNLCWGSLVSFLITSTESYEMRILVVKKLILKVSKSRKHIWSPQISKKKKNENISTYGIIVVKSNFFRSFFGRIEDDHKLLLKFTYL